MLFFRLQKVCIFIVILITSYPAEAFIQGQPYKSDSIMEAARNCLYVGNVEMANSLVGQVDSARLTPLQLGYFYLTKCFLNQKNGNQDLATDYIEKSLTVFQRYGKEKDIAETNLIMGLLLEGVSLKSEAANKYMEALNYYGKLKNEQKYLYNALGLARTSINSKKYLAASEIFVMKYPKRNNNALYFYTKATLSDDPIERKNLLLKAIEHNDQFIDVRKEIMFYTSLALNSQLVGDNDSADFYINLAEVLVKVNEVSCKRVLHYYLIQSYIQMKADNLELANTYIDTVLLNRPSFKLV